MKSITGAILLLAASVYFVALAVLMTLPGSFAMDFMAPPLWLVLIVHFILGLYFLFSKDKPKT